MVFFLQISVPKSCIHMSCPPFVLHVLSISFFLIGSPGKDFRSLSSTLCSFLHFPVTSSLLCPNDFLSTLFSNTLSLRLALNVRETKFHTHTKQQAKLQFCKFECFYVWKENGRQSNLQRTIAITP